MFDLVPVQLDHSTIEHLKSRILGSVISPTDPDYDNARQAWNLSVNQHPAVIVVAQNADDVVEAVRFAKLENLGISVQSTGHGVARPADDALLIITSKMTRVRVNATAQTAWVEAGVKWRMVLEKAQEVGLAPLLGSSSDVGVMGYTLGGGMGWLARKHGLALDSVRYFEVITADGRVVRASHNENADLFWALRGGGGNFGVITGMEIQLYPVTTVYGGNLFYPIQDAQEVFAFYREWIKNVPDAMTSAIGVTNFPSFPDIPEFLRGQTVVIMRGVFAGAIEQGAALMQDWLDWKHPMANTFHRMPFTEIDTISNEPVEPMPAKSSSAWLRDLDDETIDQIIQHSTAANGSPFVMAEIRHAGGAISRVDQNANAYGHRDQQLILQMIAITPTPEAHQFAGAYVAEFKQALAPHLSGGVYMNFLDGQEARERTQQGFLPESFHWLMMLKEKYDPENRFRYSFNIPAKNWVD